MIKDTGHKLIQGATSLSFQKGLNFPTKKRVYFLLLGSWKTQGKTTKLKSPQKATRPQSSVQD